MKIRIKSTSVIFGTGLLLQLIVSFSTFSQGKNHTWLLGYDVGLADSNVTSTKARFGFDALNYTLTPESRKLAFLSGQANISDESGNLIISTNGCWIANLLNDTLLNGTGINPGLFTEDWCGSITGIPYPHANILLPWPDDSGKFILLHQTGSYDANFLSSELFYSIIDMSLDSGKGGVVLGQKNIIAIQDTLNPGIAACKHANGRDWWITVFKDSSDIVYTLLLSTNGISNISSQSLGMTPHNNYAGQPQFSNDGSKFAYHWSYGNTSLVSHEVRLFDFDRCSGLFSNGTAVLTNDPFNGFGLSFSPNSRYLYFSSFLTIHQIDTDTSDIQASLKSVALNDTFYSPAPPFITNFFLMYLAANGKIYISSGNSVIDLHCINYPDSGGVSCDVQQHSIHLPCYSARGNVNHPNYYLGPMIGSACDTLGVGMNENLMHDFRFSISPNPSNGNIKIAYLLPQNQHGKFEIYDIVVNMIYSLDLPPWSSFQNINLPPLSGGIYTVILSSERYKTCKKLAIVK